MPLYQYVKAPPAVKRIRKRPIFISFVFMGLGGIMLAWVLWPIVSFSTLRESAFLQPVSPMGDNQNIISSNPLQPVAYAATTTEQLTQSTGVDFTNVNAWYPTSPQKHSISQVNTYSLSIPKVKISGATVVIGGDDLNSELVHYGGTGIPGQYGTTVIFGHSMLPQFYSPTNYKTIFSLLPTLEPGDSIEIEYDGVRYEYVVYDMVVVDPTDLSVLEQRFDDSYLTLVTCVPPGTYWKRLNVHAKLKTL